MTKLVGASHDILAREQPATLRQLFYRLVSSRLLDNTPQAYHRLIHAMTLARERADIPFEWFVDRSRPTYSANVFDDLEEGLTTLRNCYRKDYWQDQPRHVEIWAEKDAITGAIQPVTEELGITMRVSRGFTSTTRVHEIAAHLGGIVKPIYIYYLGDHDPSGRAIELDLYDRVSKYDGVSFHMRRLAILPEDIRAFNLPPLRVKLTDPRSARFQRTFGKEAVELDALPPDELRRRVREGIESHIDSEAWRRALRVEKVEKESIEGFVRRWKPGLRKRMGPHAGGAVLGV
jgi:hypothetical protein